MAMGVIPLLFSFSFFFLFPYGFLGFSVFFLLEAFLLFLFFHFPG